MLDFISFVIGCGVTLIGTAIIVQLPENDSKNQLIIVGVSTIIAAIILVAILGWF